MECNPLVSIVTPTYNSNDYIEDNINSIINQSYDNIEHIVVDGGSDDGTQTTLEKFENKYDLTWISEPDNGMYDAIEKGFDMASGEIYAWLNSDDMYLCWTVDIAVENLMKNGVDWVIGHPACWDKNGILHYVNPLRPHYRRKWIKNGWYHGKGLGWIQQESMFWTADLWNERGGFPEDSGLAGDYYLWQQFAEESDLKQIGTVISGFREHSGQLTENMERYYSNIPDPGITPRLMSALFIQNIYSLLLNLADRID